MVCSQADPSHWVERTCESALLVKCPKCGAIAGIINPLDDELLVSLLEPTIDMRAIPAEGS
jgi:hypothetical protein